MTRQILAISGGGFSEMENAYIDKYLLKMKGTTSQLRIAFIATASNDAQGYIDNFYKAFAAQQPTHITIQDFELTNIQEIVNACDILYVGGGNTKFMLDVWRSTGFDTVLKNAYEHGVILAGISAGAMCWFEHCYSEGSSARYEYFKGLGLLKGSFCPHYNDVTRKAYFDAWSNAESIHPLFKLKDNENLHFVNEQCIANITTF